MGGRCVDKLSSRHGTVLGVSKHGNKSIKVQWDDGENLYRYFFFCNALIISKDGSFAKIRSHFKGNKHCDICRKPLCGPVDKLEIS